MMMGINWIKSGERTTIITGENNSATMTAQANNKKIIEVEVFVNNRNPPNGITKIAKINNAKSGVIN